MIDFINSNNYQVWIKNASDYGEGHVGKDYYTLEEIKKLESQIAEGLKSINKAKVNSK